MTNKRIIWLALVLILCLGAGGVYLGLSTGPLPCGMVCEGDILKHLRFLLNRRLIASKLLQFAQEKGKNVSEWDRVEVGYSDKEWICVIYHQDDKDVIDFYIQINEEGTVTEYENLRAARERLKRMRAELSNLSDVGRMQNAERNLHVDNEQTSKEQQGKDKK